MTNLKIFHIECSGPKGIYEIEYLKAESKEIVENMLYDAAKYNTSKYYGFTKFVVKEIDEVPVTELRSIKIDIPNPTVKKLEGKIVYHMKSIRAIKIEIHEVRGDFDKYDDICNCSQHSNCRIYRKPKSSKNIHRRTSSGSTPRDVELYASNDLPLNIKYNDPINFFDTSNELNLFSVGNTSFKICTKPVIDCHYVGCNVATFGDCVDHYKCSICNEIHLTKREAKRQRKVRENKNKSTEKTFITKFNLKLLQNLADRLNGELAVSSNYDGQELDTILNSIKRMSKN